MEAGARHSVGVGECGGGWVGSVDAVCFTDNPGGNPHITPETLGRELLDRDVEVVINLSCKDYNRNSHSKEGSVVVIEFGFPTMSYVYRATTRSIGFFRPGTSQCSTPTAVGSVGDDPSDE